MGEILVTSHEVLTVVLRKTGDSEASRFSCMEFLGVSGVFDYAGLTSDSR